MRATGKMPSFNGKCVKVRRVGVGVPRRWVVEAIGETINLQAGWRREGGPHQVIRNQPRIN